MKKLYFLFIALAITYFSQACTPGNFEVDTTICAGQTYFFDGQNLDSTGTYVATFEAHEGCDSVVTLHLTVTPLDTVVVSASICAGNSYVFYGDSLKVAGDYTHTLPGLLVCDTTVLLHLTMGAADSFSVNAVTCSKIGYTFYGVYETAAGNYVHTTHTDGLCDSVVTLHLTVLTNDTTDINRFVCFGTGYDFFSSNLTASGLYHHTLTNKSGCDSVISLHLTVSTALNGALNYHGDTLVALQADTIKWLNCHTGEVTLSTTGNQLPGLVPGDEFAAILTLGTCTDTTPCFSYSGVGFAELSLTHVSVKAYPNPFTDVTHIAVTGLVSQYNFELYDVTGRLQVRKASLQATQFDLERGTLPAGVYLYRIVSGDTNVAYGKVVVANE